MFPNITFKYASALLLSLVVAAGSFAFELAAVKSSKEDFELFSAALSDDTSLSAKYVGPAATPNDSLFELFDGRLVSLPYYEKLSPSEEVTLFRNGETFKGEPSTKLSAVTFRPSLLPVVGASTILVSSALFGYVIVVAWAFELRAPQLMKSKYSRFRTAFDATFKKSFAKAPLPGLRKGPGASAALVALGVASCFLAYSVVGASDASMGIFGMGSILALVAAALVGQLGTLFCGAWALQLASFLHFRPASNVRVSELNFAKSRPSNVFRWLRKNDWDEETFRALSTGFDGSTKDLLKTSKLLSSD